MTSYDTRRKVLFQHCDPAGIVFFPRYFEMINSVVEEWFEEGLGVSFAELHGVRGRGVPTARIETDFKAPSRLGETLEFRLVIARLGRASLNYLMTAHGSGVLRLACRAVLVHVETASGRPEAWPDDLRTAIGGFIQEQTETVSQSDA